MLGYSPTRHSVSWTRTTSTSFLPTALTFGSKVFVSSRRVTVYTEPLDTWVLRRQFQH